MYYGQELHDKRQIYSYLVFLKKTDKLTNAHHFWKYISMKCMKLYQPDQNVSIDDRDIQKQDIPKQSAISVPIKDFIQHHVRTFPYDMPKSGCIFDMPKSGMHFSTCPTMCPTTCSGQDTILQHAIVGVQLFDVPWSQHSFMTCLVGTLFYDMPWSGTQMLRQTRVGMQFNDINESEHNWTTYSDWNAVLRHALVGTQLFDMPW